MAVLLVAFQSSHGPRVEAAEAFAEPPATPPAQSQGTPATDAAPLGIEEVLASVTRQYPPYLAALIERDIADGRLRAAGGVFDLQTFARVLGTPGGYYETGTVDAGMEQFLGFWGATLFGGYRLTGGDPLPDYYSQRTQGGGEARVGLRLPLLQDGSIDPRRAALLRARLDRELADPAIQRQHLDFTRAATVGYYTWAASGQRLKAAEEILRVARERQNAIERQIERGLTARIVLRENQQLVASRELGIIRARRRFEAAALALSLFHRDPRDQPVVPGRERLPPFPLQPAPSSPSPVPQPDLPPEPLSESELATASLEAALQRRPELRQLEIARERLGIDLRLARNARLPRLDATAEVSRGFGEELYKDRSEEEVKLGVEFRMPLQQSQARGALAESQARIEQLDRQLAFARDRIRTEIVNARQTVRAAGEQVARAQLNAALAAELATVEQDRFKLGAVDLLALQIREQAAFQAQIEELDAHEQFSIARADLAAALALDPRQSGPSTD